MSNDLANGSVAMIARFVFVGAAVVFAGSGAAKAQDIMELMPPGWTLEVHDKTYGGRTFLAPDGVTIAKVDHVNGSDGLGKEAESQRDGLHPYGGDSVRKSDASDVAAFKAHVAAGSWFEEETGRKTMGLSMARLHPAGRTWVCSFRTHLADKVPPAMVEWLQTCLAAADNGYFVYENDAKAAAVRTKIASVPFKGGANRPVEATLLALHYISGVGGMVLPDYYPVALFKDGVAVRNYQQPVADIDVTDFVKKQPDDVTRWTRNAKGYSLQWPDDDEPETIEASAERPKIFPAGHKLNDYWKRLSGGGNTAMGGDVSVAVSNGYRFFSDGRFSTDSAVSSSAPGVFAGSTGDDGGTYTLNGSMLVLSYGSGKVKRMSIYYGGELNDPVLWLGGDSFTN